MGDKKKLIYISPECFIDVDVPVIIELNKLYDFKWMLFIGAENFYSAKDIFEICHENKINHKIFRNSYRKRNIFQIFPSIKLILLIKQFNPDIIYFEQFENPYLSFISFFCLSTKIIVVGIHDVKPHSRHSKLLANLHKKIYLFLFKNFHVFSYTQRAIFTAKYRNKNVFVSQLNLKDYGPLPFNIREDSKVNFLFFGRIKYYKGLDILVKAGITLAKDYNNFKIIIKGSCDDFFNFQEVANHKNFELEIKNIPNKEVPNVFAKCDYLILPYRDVTQSGPLLIAYNYGIPVIASNLVGFREYIIDGVNGFLFRTENVNDLTKCMKEIIQMDKYQHLRIKKNLRKFVDQNINKTKIVRKYVNFFNNL